MSGRGSETSEQTVPVEPPVHVEVFPTHYMTMWKADSLSQFLTALGAVDSVPPTASAVVDDSSTVGREHRPVTDIEATETVRYLRVEPDTPWTVSWEQRTSPVVSVSGTPPPALCRRLHTQTTGCEGWSDDEVDSLVCALPDRQGDDESMRP